MDSLFRRATAVANDAAAEARSVDLSRFDFYVLAPRRERDAAELLVAYHCWKNVWRATLAELDNLDRVFSDDMTRQDEVGALFYEGACCGLFFHRFVDFSRPFDRDDSYFKVWPTDVLDAIAARGAKICIGSNLTVAPDWRGRPGGVSIKEILLALSVRMFMESDADVLVGTMRNDRGMNRLGLRLGAERVHGRAIHHGVEVDLIATYRRDIGPQDIPHETTTLVERLWVDAWIRKERTR
jgi:hypothetical protein